MKKQGIIKKIAQYFGIMRETLDEVIAQSGILLKPSKILDKSYSANSANDSLANLYQGSGHGAIIDRTIALILSGGFKSSIDLSNRAIMRSEIDDKFEYFIKDYYVFGAGVLIVGGDSIQNFQSSFVYPLVNINGEVELYRVEYTDINNIPVRKYFKDYKYFINNLEITITQDDKYMTITPEDIESDYCIIYKKNNDFHYSINGSSIMLRFGNGAERLEKYVNDTGDIAKLYRSPFLVITVPLAGTVDESGVDTNIIAASKQYSSWSIGDNVIKGPDEEWEIKEFNQKQIDPDVRKGYVSIWNIIYGGGDVLLGDASSANYATAKSLLQMFSEELLKPQKMLKSVIESALKVCFGIDTQITFRRPLSSILVDSEYTISQKGLYQQGVISYRTLCERLDIDYEEEIKRLSEEKRSPGQWNINESNPSNPNPEVTGTANTIQ